MQIECMIRRIAIFLGIIVLLLILVPLNKVNAETEKYFITLGDGSFTESRKVGDVNLDGVFTSRDVDLLTKNLTNVSGYENLPGKMNGDFNDDYSVNMEDLKSIDEEGTIYTPVSIPLNTIAQKATLLLKLTKESAYGSEDYNIQNVIWKTTDSSIAKVKKVSSEGAEVSILTNGNCSIEARIDGKVVDKLEIIAISNSALNPTFRTTYIYPKNGFDGIINLTTNGSDRTVRIKISREDASSTNHEKIAAINAKVRIDIDSEPEIIPISENWEITEKNYSNGLFNFIAEEKDEYLISNNSQDCVEFDLIYGSSKTTKFGCSQVSLDNMYITDTENKIYNLDGVENERKITELAEKNILVKKQFKDRIEIKKGVNNQLGKMYVKLNGTNNGEKSYATTTDLKNCLDIAERL